MLISLDILLEWREHFKRGHPISNVIDAAVTVLVVKSQVSKDSISLNFRFRIVSKVIDHEKGNFYFTDSAVRRRAPICQRAFIQRILLV